MFLPQRPAGYSYPHVMLQDPGLRGPADPFSRPRFLGAPPGIAVTPIQDLLRGPFLSAAVANETTDMQQVRFDAMSLLAPALFAAQS